MMSAAKTLAIYAIVGGFLAFIATSLVIPPMLAWYNEPGTGGALCNCADLVRATTSQLLKAQGFAAAGGALLGLIVGIIVRRRSASKPRKG